MTAAETQAFRELLKDDRYSIVVSVVSSPASPGAPPTTPALPYVVIHPERDQDEQERMTGPAVHRRPSWAVHAVGESTEAAQLVMGFVDDHLRPPPARWGVVPVVEGQTTKRIRRDDLQGVDIDDTTLPAVCFQVASYSFESSPEQLPA